MYIILLIIGIIIDQVTKIWAISNLKGKDSIIVIKNWLHLNYVENSGAAFGIFQDATIIFAIITIVVCFGISYY